jgi:hypothetical protein
MNLHPLHPPHLITHTPHTKRLTKPPPTPPRAIPHRSLHLYAIPRAILPLDSLHVRTVPVVANQAADEQLRADAIRFRERERVVHEQRIAHWFVDYAVEDVG